MTATRTREVALDAVDLFAFELMDEAREIPCESATTFVRYIHSGGASWVIASGANSIKGIATLRVRGPLCDDHQHHTVRYTLSRHELGMLLSEEERRSLRSRLADLGLSVPSVTEALGLPRVL